MLTVKIEYEISYNIWFNTITYEGITLYDNHNYYFTCLDEFKTLLNLQKKNVTVSLLIAI